MLPTFWYIKSLIYLLSVGNSLKLVICRFGKSVVTQTVSVCRWTSTLQPQYLPLRHHLHWSMRASATDHKVTDRQPLHIADRSRILKYVWPECLFPISDLHDFRHLKKISFYFHKCYLVPTVHDVVMLSLPPALDVLFLKNDIMASYLYKRT